MKSILNHINFYITNVCNFNCTHCSNFNDYYFSGQQKWEDHKDVYKKWGEKVEINQATILGGEALLNPTVLEWIDGIAEIWPDTDIAIVTNGTHLNRVKNLYDTVAKYNGRVRIEITLHNIDRRDEVIADSKEFLNDIIYEEYDHPSRFFNPQKWKRKYNKIRSDNWPDCDTHKEYHNLPAFIQDECKDIYRDIINRNCEVALHDTNNVKINILTAHIFENYALIRNDSVFSLHDSDPSKAYDVCTFKHCSFFKKGELYQCPIVTHLPEFQEQFHMDLTEEDNDIIINGYDPLTVDHSPLEVEQFINTMGKQVPACKFCPEKLTMTELTSGTNKIRVKKRKP
jgi:organic radical activating enzyme